MFGMRPLAATSHADPEWLLNNADLSYVHWSEGNDVLASEIVVEVAAESMSSILNPGCSNITEQKMLPCLTCTYVHTE